MSRSLLLAAVAGALAQGCVDLDFLVFRTLKAPPGADVFAGSTVPERLREYHDDIDSTDGVKVSLMLARHDGAEGDRGDPARNGIGVLYCHGQSNWIGTGHPRIDVLWAQGYTVAVFDARGYGNTPGTPTEVGVVADTDAARAWLEGRMGGAARVGLYGRSLGSALCLASAARRSPGAVALESPIGSVEAFINDSLGVTAPSEWFVDSVLDNFAAVQRHTGALLVMHGTADDFVQPAYGERLHQLAEASASSRDLWLVEGANHDTVPCQDLAAPNRDNGCDGGFSAEYLRRVSALFDALR